MNPQPLRPPARDRGWSSEMDVRERRYASSEVRAARYGEEDDRPDRDDARVCPDARVRAVVDVPEYEVCCGEIGIVCSTWNLPWRLIEVEFTCVVSGEIKRALLNPDQIEVHDAASPVSSDGPGASDGPDGPDAPARGPKTAEACDETEDELQPA